MILVIIVPKGQEWFTIAIHCSDSFSTNFKGNTGIDSKEKLC